MNKHTTTLTKIPAAAAVLLALLAAGCGVDTPEPVDLTIEQPTGEAIFSNYVAIGNSLTAGFMDGGLVRNGQVNSYPQLIASALGYPAGSFMQPLIAMPGIGSTSLVNTNYAAGVLHSNGASIAVVDSTLRTDIQSTLLLTAQWPVAYQNLGVPGATLSDGMNATSSANSQSPGNSYFDFILRNSVFGGVVMCDQAASLGPTLVTCWLGNNDALGGATSGEPVLGVNVTPPAAFAVMYEALLDRVTSTVFARTGFEPIIITANVPDIASTPYFMPKTTFRAMAHLPGPDALPDANLFGEADVVYVRFPALGYLSTMGMAGLPLPEQYTLDIAETAVVADAVTGFNAAIAAAVDERDNVHLYDAHAALAALTPGQATHFLALVGSGLTPVAAAATTYFSLDGIHPNNRGYGHVANGFIATINEALDTSIPSINLAGLAWDPTYGIPIDDKAATGLSPEAARAMDAIFR
ncbi:MAG: hypothetical protein IPH09_00180 [bacterium]|nr:hypothetical protein [bacterium]